MKRNLTNSEMSKVCDLIAARIGLNFPAERWSILGRNLALAAREFGFQDMTGFIQWLLSTELDNDQIKTLASHLTISETYFWRENHVFSALTDYILPELIKSKKNNEKIIRIWSAGCSTGEEAYSLAMALHKTIPGISDWNITILATDINPKSLDKAATGIYGPWSFRNTPEWLITSYFHPLENRKFEVIPEIKKMVTFSCLSLTRDDMFSAIGNKMDIIFCRNVLMYFTPDWVTRISQNLFHSLSEDGWFVVSSSELSSQVFPQFNTVNFPGAVLYNKAKNGGEKPQFNISTPSTLQPAQLSSAIAFLNTEASAKVVAKADLQLSSSEALAKEDIQQNQTTPEESYNNKIFAIRLLANQGYLPEALSLCNEAMEMDKLALSFYFIRASILQEMGKNSEAIASLKQAIYIDPDYIMGHFTLGNLFIGQGNPKDAKRYFNNALGLLNRCKKEDILPESEGLSVKYLQEIIFANLQTQ